MILRYLKLFAKRKDLAMKSSAKGYPIRLRDTTNVCAWRMAQQQFMHTKQYNSSTLVSSILMKSKRMMVSKEKKEKKKKTSLVNV